MEQLKPIAIPLSQRWRRFRYRGLPVLFFLASISLCIWLWDQQVGLPSAIGEVEAIRVQVVSHADGELISSSSRPQTQYIPLAEVRMLTR